MGYPDSTISIRIGAIVPDSIAICGSCLPDVPHPHVIPCNRFALLVWMPVITKASEGVKSSPFGGDIHTLPLEIDGVQAMNHSHPGMEQFVRYIHCN